MISETSFGWKDGNNRRDEKYKIVWNSLFFIFEFDGLFHCWKNEFVWGSKGDLSMSLIRYNKQLIEWHLFDNGFHRKWFKKKNTRHRFLKTIMQCEPLMRVFRKFWKPSDQMLTLMMDFELKKWRKLNNKVWKNNLSIGLYLKPLDIYKIFLI